MIGHTMGHLDTCKCVRLEGEGETTEERRREREIHNTYLESVTSGFYD